MSKVGRVAVVDESNVAREERTGDRHPMRGNITRMHQVLERSGFRPVAQWRAGRDWLERRRVPFMVVDGNVQLFLGNLEADYRSG